MAENTARTASRLCQSCGLCCTGLLFPFVTVSKSDNFVYEHPDLELKATASTKKNMTLGCTFLDGTRCSIYDNRPSKCQSYSCNLHRGVLNGSEDGEDAFRIIAGLRFLIDAIDPLLIELSGKSFRVMNFRDFCHDFAKDATARLADGGALNASEQQFVIQAFEIIKILDCYLVNSSRLSKFASLMAMEDQWSGTLTD